MRLIVNLLISTIAVVLGSYILPGVTVDSLITAFVVAIVMAFVNSFLKPVLVLLTLPISVITLGIFLLIINGILILLVAQVVPGFRVDGLFTAIIFSVLLSIIGLVLDSLS